MRTTIPSAGGLLLLSLCTALVAGCATSTPGPAPVHDRNASRKPTSAAPSGAARETGTHLVQRGETLYSIARQYGQDPKNIIIWNQLENPNSIAPGQRILVGPPGASPAGAGSADAAVAEVQTVTPQAGVEARPLAGWPAPAAAGAGQATPATQVPAALPAGSIKQEPRGGKQPYSEQAWAKARAGDEKPAGGSAMPAPSSSVPSAASGDSKTTQKPENASARATDAKPAEGNSTTRLGEDGIDWSWPASGKIVGGFNDSNSKGIDIGGKTGDPVLAAASGKVHYVGEGIRSYGKLVVLKHNGHFLTVYGYNSKVLVKEGATVVRGEKIAEVGEIEVGQPRLHFEIRRQGKPVDPLQYLPAR